MGDWNLLESLPDVPLRKVLGLLNHPEKKNVRLVSKRCMRLVWFLDSKFRIWYVDKNNVEGIDIASVVNNNYSDLLPELVVITRCCMGVLDKELASLLHRVIGFSLRDDDCCTSCLHTFEPIKILSIRYGGMGKHFLNLKPKVWSFLKNSSSTLVSLQLSNLDLSCFLMLPGGLPALNQLEIGGCRKEAGLIKLLQGCFKSLKSLKFKGFSELDLTSVVEHISCFPRLEQLEIMHGPRLPAQFIQKSRTTLRSLKFGHITARLTPLLQVYQLPKLKELEIYFCILNADLDCLLSMAKSLTRFHLESCTNEDFAAMASTNLLNNIEDLTLDVSSNGEARHELMMIRDDNAMTEVIAQIFEQPCNKLTSLKFVGVDLMAFEERGETGMPITLPKCLKHLEIRHSEQQLDVFFPQEESVLLVLNACPPSLETLILKTKVKLGRLYRSNNLFPQLRKLELEFLSYVGSIFYHTRNLEELSLTINVFVGLRELLRLPARMPTIKSLQIFTHSTTSEGYEYLWRTLDTVSESLVSFKLILVTPFYNETKVEIEKDIKLPCLTNLDIFGFYEAVPALIKLCSGSLVNLKVTGRESSWISQVDCNLPVLRKAVLSPTPNPDELAKLKKKCPDTTIFPKVN